jgi:hypothetical protein
MASSAHQDMRHFAIAGRIQDSEHPAKHMMPKTRGALVENEGRHSQVQREPDFYDGDQSRHGLSPAEPTGQPGEGSMKARAKWRRNHP